MSGAWPRVLIAALPVALSAAALGCRPSPQRESRDYERMRHQQRYNAYEESAVLPGGLVNQAPPAGTIPRSGEQPVPNVVLTGMAAGQATPTVPISASDSLLQTGAEHFAVSCSVCHGAAGFGGSVIASNMMAMRPPSLHSPAIRSLTPGAMFQVITHGSGRMPALDWQLTPTERWAVIAYVRALQSSPARDSAARADSVAGATYARLDTLRLERSGVRP